jgi:hypothetical protein
MRGALAMTFQDGNFITRRSRTGEVLARGTYTATAVNVTMEWRSIATQKRLTATCTAWGAHGLLCQQPGGNDLHFRRAN